MSRSVYEVNQILKKGWGTLNQRFKDFKIKDRVRVIVHAQDFHLFNGDELGTVVENSGEYLGIIVKFDKPRHFEGGYVQKEFNFAPEDLLNLTRKKSRWYGKRKKQVACAVV